jgi:hypothetical protein
MSFDINLIDKGFILFRYGFSLRVGIPLLRACCLVAVDLIAIINMYLQLQIDKVKKVCQKLSHALRFAVY